MRPSGTATVVGLTSVDIVVTTVFEPAWLEGYLGNLRAYDRVDQVTLRIICDRKTPSSVPAAAAAAKAQGFRVDCPSLDQQASYLKSIGISDDLIPWDSDNRRNIGFLRAWESGADILISIDDDNHCRADSDFVGCHSVVGAPSGEAVGDSALASGRWFNICSMLEGARTESTYPRGYPYWARGTDREDATTELTTEVSAMRITANAGLWLDDPDVDAITRLALAPRAETASQLPVTLGPDTWSPINTQNTAIAREAIPAYYYVRMGYPLQGMRIDRFGDIMSGYLLQKCAKHLGQVIRIGSPVADHRRSPHDLFKDLYHELAGIILLEDLVPWLIELDMSSTTYPEAYAELSEALAAATSRFTGFVWDEGGRGFLSETAHCMNAWLAALKTLGG